MADINLLTNTQLQQLNAQITNPQGFPNVNPTRYFSVERLLKSALNFSYGVRNEFTGQPFSSGQTVDFLVLATQGGAANAVTGEAAKNIPNLIFLANKAIPGTVAPAPATPSFTLVTPFNSNTVVTVKKVKAQGVLQVNESIVTDFLAVKQPDGSFKNLETASAGNVYLRVPRNLAMAWGFK